MLGTYSSGGQRIYVLNTVGFSFWMEKKTLNWHLLRGLTLGILAGHVMKNEKLEVIVLRFLPAFFLLMWFKQLKAYSTCRFWSTGSVFSRHVAAMHEKLEAPAS